jgi:hypothetical protein
MKPRIRKFAAWIAVAGIALNALSPLAAGAASGSNRDISMEICSVSGSHQISNLSDSGSPSDGPTESGPHRGHCALCSPGGHAVALHAAPLWLQGRVELVSNASHARALLPAEHSPYISARPRSPPLDS